MDEKQPGRNGLISWKARLAISCAFLSLCQFEGAQGVHRIALPQHPNFISRHYRETSHDTLNDDAKVNAEMSLLESLLAYVTEQRKHNLNVSPSECEDSSLAALIQNKVKRALAEEDYKTLYFNKVRDDLAKTLGEKKIGAMSDISEHLKKNFKDEARRKSKIVKREILNENYYKTLYIQKIADDIKSDLTKTNTKNIPVSKLDEIVKRELEDNFKSQYIAKVTNIVKEQLEQDLKQVAKRDARWNEANAEWIRKEVELLYRLEEAGGRDKRDASNDLPADFKTLYIQRIADDVKREVVERNMTNVSVNKLNEIVKRELENNLKSDYVAKLTAFLKGQLEDTLRNITPDISRNRREAHSVPREETVLYVDPGFRDFLSRVERDLGPPVVDGNLSGDAIGKLIQAFLTGQFAIRVDDTKVEPLNDAKTNSEENSDIDKADMTSGSKSETESANPYLPALRHHEPREKTHHLDVQDKSEDRLRDHDKDKGVIIDGVPENEYFNIEPFDKEVAKTTAKGDEEDVKDEPPYMLNYYKRDHSKEHASSDSCDNATKKPCDKRPPAQAKKGKYCKVKVGEGGAPPPHHKPGSEGCSSTCSSNRTTSSCSTTPKCSTTHKCSTTSSCSTTHRPGGKKCGGKASPSKSKSKGPSCKPANASDAVVSGDFVRFEIFNVNIPTRMLNASSTGEGGGGKCGRRSSDGVSLAKGNRHVGDKVPVKVNYKGEKSVEKKTWHRRHNAVGKVGNSMGLEVVREADGDQGRLAGKRSDRNQEGEDEKPMVTGRRRLLSSNEEENDDKEAAVDGLGFEEDYLRQDLDVDWAKALAPHLSIRKRDLSTDPLNGYPADSERDGKARVKRTADGFADDDGDVRRNCFDDEEEVASSRVGSDQQPLDGQNDAPSDDLEEVSARVNRLQAEGNDMRGFGRAEPSGIDDERDAEIISSFRSPSKRREFRRSPGPREKRNSDGSLCVLLKATIKEDDHGDNDTKLTINGKADYKLSVKNEGKEGVGNEATNLTMNGAANLNQEFDMPKQCPGEAMREISAELVDKLNSLGSCGGAERLMAPQDGGKRVGRVATTGGSKAMLVPQVPIKSDASVSRRVGRVADGDVNDGKVLVDSRDGKVPSGEEKSVEINPMVRGAAVETKPIANTEGKGGAGQNIPLESKLPVQVAKVAPIVDTKGVARGVDDVAKVGVGVNVPAKKEVKTGVKMSRRSNTDLYQIGLGKLLVALKRNKVSARDAGKATSGDDVGKLFEKVESALGMTDFHNSLDLGKDKTKLGGKMIEDVNIMSNDEVRKPEKRSVPQAGESRLRDLMESFGNGNHHDDEIGKRDLIDDLYESFGPVDADVEEFHVKKELDPNADSNSKDENKISKRSVGDAVQPERLSSRQRRWHPGYQSERDFKDVEPGDVNDHVSRVEELLSARRARGRPSWSSLGLDIAGYVRDKRMSHWSAHVDDFQHILRDIVQSNHDDLVAGFDGLGHYYNPMLFLKPVPDRRKRNFRAHIRRQLQPEEEDEMIDADGQTCGGRRHECDGQDEPPRPRPEKLSTDEPEDPGDCDEATEEGAEASVGASRSQANLIAYVGLITLCWAVAV